MNSESFKNLLNLAAQTLPKKLQIVNEKIKKLQKKRKLFLTEATEKSLYDSYKINRKLIELYEKSNACEKFLNHLIIDDESVIIKTLHSVLKNLQSLSDFPQEVINSVHDFLISSPLTRVDLRCDIHINLGLFINKQEIHYFLHVDENAGTITYRVNGFDEYKGIKNFQFQFDSYGNLLQSDIPQEIQGDWHPISKIPHILLFTLIQHNIVW